MDHKKQLVKPFPRPFLTASQTLDYMAEPADVTHLPEQPKEF